MRNQRVSAALLLIAILWALALVGPLLAHDPITTSTVQSLQNAAPSPEHPLGTDFFGRDVLGRVLYGARISLSIGTVSVLLSLLAGTAVGLVAGFSGGVIDAALMRMVDALLAIPRFFLLLVVVALLEGAGVGTMILLLGFTSWFETSRLVRAEVLSLKTRDYVSASRALGLPDLRVILRHLLPNAVNPILVAGALSVANIILIEAGLSYLGMGVAPPTPSLGNMLHDGQEFVLRAPWAVISPGLFLILTVLAFATLGEGLREINQPGSVDR